MHFYTAKPISLKFDLYGFLDKIKDGFKVIYFAFIYHSEKRTKQTSMSGIAIH